MQLHEQQAQALQRVYGASAGAWDFIQWRVRHRVPDGAKVFCMAGG